MTDIIKILKLVKGSGNEAYYSFVLKETENGELEQFETSDIVELKARMRKLAETTSYDNIIPVKIMKYDTVIDFTNPDDDGQILKPTE